MRLLAGSSSLFRVAPSEISLDTSVIVLRSSPSPSIPVTATDKAGAGTTPITNVNAHRTKQHLPPPSQEGVESGMGAGSARGVSSGLSLDGGILEATASASIGLTSHGALVQLFGRSNTTRGGSNTGESGGDRSAAGVGRGSGYLAPDASEASMGARVEPGEVVVDADAVRIRGRSTSAGVSISADGANPSVGESMSTSAGGWRDDVGGWARNETTAGGHLKVTVTCHSRVLLCSRVPDVCTAIYLTLNLPSSCSTIGTRLRFLSGSNTG